MFYVFVYFLYIETSLVYLGDLRFRLLARDKVKKNRMSILSPPISASLDWPESLCFLTNSSSIRLLPNYEHNL